MSIRYHLAFGLFLLILTGFYASPLFPPVPEHTSLVPENEYPRDYFMEPVESPLLVTGTFCELRSDHFHSGLDLKSATGKSGQSVFAAADGYIDQIKVQASGYGNVVYIKHPNGYTTVYAHLDRFKSDLARYVKAVQYKRERFEVVIDCSPGQFPVKKGEEIGKMGNSGSSTGPHLHFEIRNSTTGKTINPLLFGLNVQDKRPPELRDMKVYFLKEDRSVIYSKPLPLERRKSGEYGLKGGANSVAFGAWRIGLGLKTYDETDVLHNDNGPYGIEVYANEALIYRWLADELDFDDTRYLNAHIDYGTQKRSGAWFNRLFTLPGNQLPMYDHTEQMGVIPLSIEKPVAIKIKAYDAAGNTSSIAFEAMRSADMFIPPSESFQYIFPWNQENKMSVGNFAMTLPKGALYEDLKFKFETGSEPGKTLYSPVYHLHNNATPVHKYFEISIVPDNVPAEVFNKAVIARLGGRKPDNCGGKWVNGRLTTRVRSGGQYAVMVDQTPPVVTPVVFAADMREKPEMVFQIGDDFDPSDQAARLSWRGTIDGQWALFEMDSKRNRLTHRFDEHVGPGEHQLRLVVTDDRGNKTVFEQAFTR